MNTIDTPTTAPVGTPIPGLDGALSLGALTIDGTTYQVARPINPIPGQVDALIAPDGTTYNIYETRSVNEGICAAVH